MFATYGRSAHNAHGRRGPAYASSMGDAHTHNIRWRATPARRARGSLRRPGALPTNVNHTVVGAVDFEERASICNGLRRDRSSRRSRLWSTSRLLRKRSRTARARGGVRQRPAGALPFTHPTRADDDADVGHEEPAQWRRRRRTQGELKVVFGMLVFFVPLGLALLYCLRGASSCWRGRRGARTGPARLAGADCVRRAYCLPSGFALSFSVCLHLSLFLF